MFIFQVDFGCGSGSLLDSLLEHRRVLEQIITAGIARKGLIGEAEVLNISAVFAWLWLMAGADLL